MAHNYKWRWPSEVRHKFTGMVIIITMTLVNKKWYLCKRSNMWGGGGRRGEGGSKFPTSLTCNCVPFTPTFRPFFFAFFFQLQNIEHYIFLELHLPLPSHTCSPRIPPTVPPSQNCSRIFLNKIKQPIRNYCWNAEERIFNFRKQETNVKYLQDIPWLII